MGILVERMAGKDLAGLSARTQNRVQHLQRPIRTGPRAFLSFTTLLKLHLLFSCRLNPRFRFIEDALCFVLLPWMTAKSRGFPGAVCGFRSPSSVLTDLSQGFSDLLPLRS
jgi:hypothetical protein